MPQFLSLSLYTNHPIPAQYASPTILYTNHPIPAQSPDGRVDSSDKSARKGSNVYEVNIWLWQFGLGGPRLGGLSVGDTEERRIAVMQDGARRGHATRTKRKLKAAGREAQFGRE